MRAVELNGDYSNDVCLGQDRAPEWALTSYMNSKNFSDGLVQSAKFKQIDPTIDPLNWPFIFQREDRKSYGLAHTWPIKYNGGYRRGKPVLEAFEKAFDADREGTLKQTLPENYDESKSAQTPGGRLNERLLET